MPGKRVGAEGWNPISLGAAFQFSSFCGQRPQCEPLILSAFSPLCLSTFPFTHLWTGNCALSCVLGVSSSDSSVGTPTKSPMGFRGAQALLPSLANNTQSSVATTHTAPDWLLHPLHLLQAQGEEPTLDQHIMNI